MIYAKTLSDIERVAKTPAGGGDISPAPAVPATSLEARSTAGDAGVVEQRTADDSPPPVGSDEMPKNHYGYYGTFRIDAAGDAHDSPYRIDHNVDDDSDPHAFPRSRRLICSVSSDGQTTIHRMGSSASC